jgi:hypothetical protein
MLMGAICDNVPGIIGLSGLPTVNLLRLASYPSGWDTSCISIPSIPVDPADAGRRRAQPPNPVGYSSNRATCPVSCKGLLVRRLSWGRLPPKYGPAAQLSAVPLAQYWEKPPELPPYKQLCGGRFVEV